jgi:hypothetical protein
MVSDTAIGVLPTEPPTVGDELEPSPDDDPPRQEEDSHSPELSDTS